MKNQKLKIKNYRNGFTLIEIIVSISIFTVVMLVTMGALLTLNDSSRKAQALRTVIDNLNFAVEDMNRKIRTGDIYHCYDTAGQVVSLDTELTKAVDCPTVGGQAISLKTQEVERPAGNPTADPKHVWVAYVFRPGDENGNAGRIWQRRSNDGGGANLSVEESAITSPEVDIKQMKFRVVGANPNANPRTQPMVIVSISGVVDLHKEKLKTDFSLQTAISRRGEGE